MAALAAAPCAAQKTEDEVKADKYLDKKERTAAEEAALIEKKLSLCKEKGGCPDGGLKPIKKIPATLKPVSKPRQKKKKKPAATTPNSVPEAEAATPIPVPVAEASTPNAGLEAEASAPTPERVETIRRDADERSRRTMNRASGSAESLRRSIAAEDEPGPEGSARLADGPERERRAGDEGPRTVPEMALALRAGFTAPFHDLGLKVGSGPRGEPAIQRADGSLASPAELERLGEALRSEPAALIRRPDFFAVLPREKFADLKRDYARPERRAAAFKDIGLTEGGRDFQWTASCNRLSGGCNAGSAASSYRRGQDVSPETLRSVWAAARAAPAQDVEAEEEFSEYTEADRLEAAAEDAAEEKLALMRARPASLGALLARMAAMARGLGESAGLDPGSVRAAAPAASPAAAPRSAGEGSSSVEGGASAPALTAARSSGRFEAPPSPWRQPAAADRNQLGLAAAAALLVLVLLRKLRV